MAGMGADDHHLTDEVLRGYASGTLEVSALAEALQHVGHCEACREALARAAGAAERVKGAWALGAAEPEVHPDPEALMALADGMLDHASALTLRAHMAVCDTCAEDLADFEAARGELHSSARAMSAELPAEKATSPVLTSPWLRLAAAAVLATVTGGVWWMNRLAGTMPSDQLARTSAAPAPQSPSGGDTPAVVLTDGVVSLLADGAVRGLDLLEAPDRAVVEGLLHDQRLPSRPPDPALRPPQGALMGAPAAPARLRLLTPIGVIVASDRPTLTWTAVPGATAYRVSLYDARLVPQAESGDLTRAEWTPPAPLVRGALYLWQVEADTQAGTLRAPGADAPDARFRVLSAADAASLRALEQASPASPLLLGARYAALGLREDAARQFEVLAAANPASPLAAALAREARAQVPSPTRTNGAQ